MTPLECVFASVQSRIQCDYAVFERAFTDFELVPIWYRGKTVGAVMRRGPEVHIAIEPTYQGRIWLRPVLQHELQETIKRFGRAVTSVSNDHVIGHRLARLLGFRVTSKDHTMTHYERMP
jgi:hypothetical protein